MATTKKSSKAKTKKPASNRAAKTTKSTTTKRITTKTAKNTVSTKVTKPVKTSNKSTSSLLTKLNILSAFISLSLAALAGLLMNNKSYEIVNGLLAKDELASKTSDVLVPAVNHLVDVELRWLVVAILLLSAVIPILHITLFKARYIAALRSRINLLRWIDMAVISTLMLEIVALVSGVQDILVLKLVAGLLVVTCLLGWIAEKRNQQAGRPVWSEVGISLVTGFLPWILIAGYAISTVVHGNVSIPVYVYALYAAVFLGSSALCMNLINHVRRHRGWTNYEVVERNYLIISILTKVAFAAALIAGLQK